MGLIILIWSLCLLSPLRKAQESQKEMKLLLDMYKSAPKEQRDKVQLMAAERKSKAEVCSLVSRPSVILSHISFLHVRKRFFSNCKQQNISTEIHMECNAQPFLVLPRLMSWGCECESWRRGRGRKARSWRMRMPSGRSEWQKRPLSICRRNLLPLNRCLSFFKKKKYH